MVEEGQGVPKIGPKMMTPHSRLGIHLLHGVLNIASKSAVRGLASKILAHEPKTPDLSAYPHTSQTASELLDVEQNLFAAEQSPLQLQATDLQKSVTLT